MMTREQLIQLTRALIELEVPEEEEGKVVETLKRETSDPNVTDYIYYAETPLSPEDIVDLALGLRNVKWKRISSR